MRRTSLILTALAVLLSACGGSDDTGSDAEFRDLIADHLQTANALEGAVSFTDSEADCAATAIVEEFGTATLADLGYDPASGSMPNLDSLGPDLSVGDRGRWFDGIERCIDMPGQVSSLLEDAGLSIGVASCVADAYVASGLIEEALMEGAFDPELNNRIEVVLTQAMADCGG